MSTRDRIIRPLTLSALLLVATGCGRDRPSGEAPDDHQEHAGHVIPAHKPKSFPDAVHRLEELDRAIASGAADARTLAIAADVASWLPEVAAESDMPEAPWDEVDRLSASLVAKYRARMGSSADRTDAARGSGPDVAALAIVLEKSDPRWFDGPIARPGNP